MKLNNKGWGLLQMVIFLVMFFIFIMIIAVISYKLGIAGTNNF